MDPAQVIPSLVVAAVALVALGIPFGFGRKAVGLAVLLALAVNGFYPGGSAELLVDSLRPIRMLAAGAEDQRDGRAEAVERAVDGAPKAAR